MAGKYKINRSNYTLRTRHQLINGGAVYERDFMTTTNLGQWDSGSIPYGEGNFRMVHRRKDNARKHPKAGMWVEPKNCETSNGFWTSGCVSNTAATEENLIKIKPNYGSLLDFAYYGSCEELVKSTIKKIIETFPGEIVSYAKEKYTINGTVYYMVENPFNVDLFGDGFGEGIRNFSENYAGYTVITQVGDNEVVSPISRYEVTRRGQGCEHGSILATAQVSDITIYKIIYDSEPLLFTERPIPFEIRPNEAHVNEFFDGLDDFGKLLLNRESYPKYTATIDWPHDTEYGVKTYKRSFTWPLDGKWNLDINSPAYGEYLENLLSIASFYDEGYTDNLWRMLTHDSIKSMDLAFSNPSKDEDKEDYNIGATRLEGLLWAYGRQFDDLKRAIDNIKFTSNITYDESNNMPDYFLSDSLELSGWEVYNADRGIEDKSVSLSWNENSDFKGSFSKVYSAEDANNIFLRELKLNSAAIFKKKGTKAGFRSLLGLFGLREGVNYEIEEYVAAVESQIEKIGINEKSELERLNSLKYSYPTSMEAKGFNVFEGIPFTYVENDNEKYIIPWFDRHLIYDGGLYFQMKGGWGKKISSASAYDETMRYLTVVENVSDLYELPFSKRYEGALCYVESEDEYYEVTNEMNSDAENGWAICTNQSKIDRIKSIVDDFKGNNPHVGYGNYDGGNEFIERIRAPFSYHVNANTPETPMFSDAAYDCNGKYDNGFDTTQFNVEKIPVKEASGQKKTMFFGEYINENWAPDSFASNMDMFDFETGLSNRQTAAAANSIINLKELKFTFYTLPNFVTEFTKYLENVILPYLKQLIPSTTIWSYSIATKDVIAVETLWNEAATSPISLVVDAVAYGGNSDDIADDYIANYTELHNSRSW